MGVRPCEIYPGGKDRKMSSVKDLNSGRMQHSNNNVMSCSGAIFVFCDSCFLSSATSGSVKQ